MELDTVVPRLSIPTLDRRVGPQFPGAAGHLRHFPRPLDSRQRPEAPRTTLCGVPPGAWAAVWGKGTPCCRTPRACRCPATGPPTCPLSTAAFPALSVRLPGFFTPLQADSPRLLHPDVAHQEGRSRRPHLSALTNTSKDNPSLLFFCSGQGLQRERAHVASNRALSLASRSDPARLWARPPRDTAPGADSPTRSRRAPLPGTWLPRTWLPRTWLPALAVRL